MTNIIVGCGGSGAKIAASMAALMGQDPSWRYKMDENVFFLLLDTDAQDLDNSERAIKNAAPDIHVTSVVTTAGYTNPGDILQGMKSGMRTGDPKTDKLALQRFAEHWWCNEPNASDIEKAQPFQIPKVVNLATGAGQVPMVSYLAAWRAMESTANNPTSIETAISGLCTSIVNIRSNEPTTERRFNVFFVGSLAGGTGRGALVPVAFKLKEVFYERFRQVPFISAYLLDQDCFERTRQPQNDLPQRMNAMTGWSEIAGWLNYYEEQTSGNSKNRSDYSYFLPGSLDMHNPSNDVISSMDSRRELQGVVGRDDNRGDTGRLRTPFDAVGVIGRKSGLGYEAKAIEQIYEMVATSLYVRLTQSKVNSEISNESRVYFSIGSSVTKVPYHEIETFFKQKACLDSVYVFQSPATKEMTDRSVADIMNYLGMGDPLGQMLGFKKDTDVTTPMQAFAQECHQVNGYLDSKMASLKVALDDQDLDSCQSALDEIFSENRLEDPLVLTEVADSYVREFCKHSLTYHGSSAVNTALQIEEQVIGRTLKFAEDTNSIQVLADVAAALVARFQHLVNELFSKKGIEAWIQDPVAGRRMPSAAAVLDEAKDREGLFGKTIFTEDEKAAVLAETKRELVVFTLRALGKALAGIGQRSGTASSTGLVARIIGKLEQLQNNARFLVKCAAYTKDRINIRPEILMDEGKRLFVSDDNLVDSFPGDLRGNVDYHICRVIRPPYPQSDGIVLCSKESIEEAMNVLREGKVYDPHKDNPTKHESLLGKLESAFRKSRYRGRIEGDTCDIMEKFHLVDVLRDLANVWRDHLQKMWDEGDKDKYQKIAQQFRNYFGIEPEVRGETVDITGNVDLRGKAGNDYMLLGLATASVRSCKPFWSTNRFQQPHFIVQIPIDLQDRKASWQELIEKGSGLAFNDRDKVDLITDGIPGSHEVRNPYVMAVYTSSGASSLDEVESLDAWRKDATLLACLVAAESPSPLMPFNKEILELWPDYRGSGFMEPSYILRPELRRNRWRPWIPTAVREKEALETAGNKLNRIAVYSVLGPRWYLVAALGAAEADRVIAASGLSPDPIFAEGERKMFKLGRLPLQFKADGNATKSSADIRINEGSNVTQSIRTIPEVLTGQREARSMRGADGDHLLELGKAVELEYEGFFDVIADRHGFHHASARAAHLRMLEALKAKAIEERGDSNPNQEDGDRKFWQQLLEEIESELTATGN